MKTRVIIATALFLAMGAAHPLQAQFGLKKAMKKVKKAGKKIKKTSEEETLTSPWENTPQTTEGQQQETEGQQNAQRATDEPSDADLQRMNQQVNDIMFQYSYVYDVKNDPENGKLYLVAFHKKEVHVTLSEGDVKKIVAVRDALPILEHYNAMSKEELQGYKKRVADMIEGNNNSVAEKKQEQYDNNVWKPHNSQAPRLAQAQARVTQAVKKRLSNIEMLDSYMEDEWVVLDFHRGLDPVKKTYLDGAILYYDLSTKEYKETLVSVYDEYYLAYPNDVKKEVDFVKTTVLERGQVPKKFLKD